MPKGWLPYPETLPESTDEGLGQSYLVYHPAWDMEVAMWSGYGFETLHGVCIPTHYHVLPKPPEPEKENA